MADTTTAILHDRMFFYIRTLMSVSLFESVSAIVIVVEVFAVGVIASVVLRTFGTFLHSNTTSVVYHAARLWNTICNISICNISEFFLFFLNIS